MKLPLLVDSGTIMLSINESIKIQLDLPILDKQVGELADGTQKIFDIVGQVDIRFKNRQTTVRAVVIPGDTEPLLGAIPMEDMDVMIDLRSEKLCVNQSSPYMAKNL